ncbi:MAG: hypothetical protein AAF989_12270 [Planctomycetota bacterium]
MSNVPQNPYEQQNPGAGYQQAPPKKSKTWLWVLGIIGGLGLVAVLVCCGGAYFMSSQFTGFMGEALAEQVKDDPVIVENVGEIESATFNMQATMKFAQDNPGANSIIIDLVGSKSEAQLAIDQDSAESGRPTGRLIMPDGTSIDIQITAESQEIDFDMGEDIGGGEPVENEFTIETD